MMRKIIVLLIIGMLLFGCTGSAKKKTQTPETTTNNETIVSDDAEEPSNIQEPDTDETPDKATAEPLVLPDLLKSKMTSANSESVIDITRLWNVQEGDRDFNGHSKWQYLTTITLKGKLKDVLPTEEERSLGIIWKYQMQEPKISYTLNNTYFFDWKPKDINNWCTVFEETFVPDTKSVAYSSFGNKRPLEIAVYENNKLEMNLPFNFEAQYYFKSNCNPEKAKGANMRTEIPIRIDIPLQAEFVKGSIIQTGTSKAYTYGAAIRTIDSPGDEKIYFNDAEIYFPPEQTPSWTISWRLVTTE